MQSIVLAILLWLNAVSEDFQRRWRVDIHIQKSHAEWRAPGSGDKIWGTLGKLGKMETSQLADVCMGKLRRTWLARSIAPELMVWCAWAPLPCPALPCPGILRILIDHQSSCLHGFVRIMAAHRFSVSRLDGLAGDSSEAPQRLPDWVLCRLSCDSLDQVPGKARRSEHLPSSSVRNCRGRTKRCEVGTQWGPGGDQVDPGFCRAGKERG